MSDYDGQDRDPKPSEDAGSESSGAERTPPAPAPATDSAGENEIGGPKGLEPTRYGDWERKGRCIDF